MLILNIIRGVNDKSVNKYVYNKLSGCSSSSALTELSNEFET